MVGDAISVILTVLFAAWIFGVIVYTHMERELPDREE